SGFISSDRLIDGFAGVPGNQRMLGRTKIYKARGFRNSDRLQGKCKLETGAAEGSSSKRKLVGDFRGSTVECVGGKGKRLQPNPARGRGSFSGIPRCAAPNAIGSVPAGNGQRIANAKSPVSEQVVARFDF